MLFHFFWFLFLTNIEFWLSIYSDYIVFLLREPLFSFFFFWGAFNLSYNKLTSSINCHTFNMSHEYLSRSKLNKLSYNYSSKMTYVLFVTHCFCFMKARQWKRWGMGIKISSSGNHLIFEGDNQPRFLPFYGVYCLISILSYQDICFYVK